MVATAALLVTPLAAVAQSDVMSGSEASARYSSALAHRDANTRALATMRNQISVRDIVTVAIGPLRNVTHTWSYSPQQRAALAAALDKATVADTDRRNGASEDQSSLADYLRHLGVDPRSVLAVDVNGKRDPQNPRVTVFFTRNGHAP
jgi:sulfur carrier protein ThiS